MPCQRCGAPTPTVKEDDKFLMFDSEPEEVERHVAGGCVEYLSRRCDRLEERVEALKRLVEQEVEGVPA